LVVLPKEHNQIFLSWRLLPSDPESLSFNIYRKDLAEKKSSKEFTLIARTDQNSYIDTSVQKNHSYMYRISPVSGWNREEFSKKVTVTVKDKELNALVFDLGKKYKSARVVTGDLNGDGELEVVIVYQNSDIVEPYKRSSFKSQDTIKVATFLHTGEHLWAIDLGWGIEAGADYAPIVIWDVDADGSAEVLLKTNRSGDPLDYDSERLTILDGKTGKIEQETNWPSIEGLGNDYNNNSRNSLAIAHLDGKNPHIIVGRGIYKTQKIQAYDKKLNILWERIIGKDLRDKDDQNAPKTFWQRLRNFWNSDEKLQRIWRRITRQAKKADIDRATHGMPIADINNDGKEEILWGEHCIGENGKDVWVIEDHMPYSGHPDVVFAADVLTSNPGKEIFYCREGWYRGKENEKIGVLLVNNKGETIWAHWGFRHVDGGWVAKIDAEQDGMQLFAYDIHKKKWTPSDEPGKELGPKLEYIDSELFLWSSDGKIIARPPNSWRGSFPVDWDGDGVQEICTKNGDVQKYKGSVVARLGGRPLWGADLFGDHREEIVVTSPEGKVFVIFNTSIRRTPPKISRIADRQYRNDLSRTAMMRFGVIPTEGGYILKK
jgi:hypothetical protein